MSPDVIGVIVTIAVATITLFGGLFGGLRVLLKQHEARTDAHLNRLEHKVDTVAGDVVDLKVAVARLQGPQPTLLRAR